MSHILQLLLLLSVIIACAKIAGAISTRIKQPAVFGELLAGLILGPTVLNILDWQIFATISDVHSHHSVSLLAVVSDLAEIGVILLMFIAGMETDLGQMKRVGKAATGAGAGGVLLPFAGGAVISYLFGFSWSQCFFIGAVLTATSVSITAQTLMELNCIKSKEGTTILGAAIIDDVLGIIVLSLVVAFGIDTSGDKNITDILWIIARIVIFFVVAIFIGWRFLESVTEKVKEIPASQVLLAFVFIVVFVYSLAAEYLGGIAAITGAYIAGVLFARTKFRDEIETGIHPVTYSLFVPLFFISIGLKANGRELGGELLFLVLIVAVAIIGKVLGCVVGTITTGFNSRESLRVGIGMISRGEVGLIIASYGLSHAIISGDIFSAMVVTVLITTMITPILLRIVFPAGGMVTGRKEVYESVAHVEEET